MRRQPRVDRVGRGRRASARRARPAWGTTEPAITISPSRSSRPAASRTAAEHVEGAGRRGRARPTATSRPCASHARIRRGVSARPRGKEDCSVEMPAARTRSTSSGGNSRSASSIAAPSPRPTQMATSASSSGRVHPASETVASSARRPDAAAERRAAGSRPSRASASGEPNPTFQPSVTGVRNRPPRATGAAPAPDQSTSSSPVLSKPCQWPRGVKTTSPASAGSRPSSV